MGKNTKEIIRSLSMITQLGLSMLAPVILCVVAGNWLDERFGWSVTVIMLILGILAGVRNTWVLIKQGFLPDHKGQSKHEKKDTDK